MDESYLADILTKDYFLAAGIYEHLLEECFFLPFEDIRGNIDLFFEYRLP